MMLMSNHGNNRMKNDTEPLKIITRSNCSGKTNWYKTIEKTKSEIANIEAEGFNFVPICVHFRSYYAMFMNKHEK